MYNTDKLYKTIYGDAFCYVQGEGVGWGGEGRGMGRIGTVTLLT